MKNFSLVLNGKQLMFGLPGTFKLTFSCSSYCRFWLWSCQRCTL